MRIMIIGAAATGKSTFGAKLSEKLSIPLIHIDTIVNSVGRDKIAEELIRKEADKLNWIIDGNSFTRDRSYRLEKADCIFIFTANRFKSLADHIKRWHKEKKEIEKVAHGRSEGLHLGFILAFTLWRWPRRQKEIIQHAKALNKKIIFIKNHKEADFCLTQFKLDKMKRIRSAGITIKDGKILLMYRRKNGNEYYVFPGGGVEENESEEDAAVREVKEETTVDVKVEKLLYESEEEFGKNFFYLCPWVSGEPKEGDGPEFKEMTPQNFYKPLWVPMEEIENLTLYPLPIRDRLIKDYKNNI